MKYTPEDKLETMSIQALGDFFHAIYESMYRGEHNNMRSITAAYYDAVGGIRGKAGENRILPNDANDDKLIQYMQNKKSYFIQSDGYEEDERYLKNFLEEYCPYCKPVKEKDAQVILSFCNDIFGVKDLSLKKIYIDPYRNVILDEEDCEAVKNYAYSKMFFIYMNQSAFLDACDRLRRTK
jgi:hypothetical protein